MTVSLIIVARNAASHLPGLFSDLLQQDYPSDNMEFVFVLAESIDRTAQLVAAFRASHPDLSVQILDNPGRILSSGWNMALAHATGDVLLRVDAHARISPSFVREAAKCIGAGESVVGGPCLTAPSDGIWAKVLGLAESSRFGGGAAAFRQHREAGPVDTLAYAAYRRSVFAKVGGYDERLVRTEDNEMHHRMKQAGYRFYYSPIIESRHCARDTLAGLLKQKFGNGLWIGLTLAIQPRCFGIRHFVPGLFFLALLTGVALGLAGWWIPLIALSLVYGAAATGFAVRALLGPEAAGIRAMVPMLPFIFFLMHLAYGFGTAVGIIRLPWFWVRNRHYRLPWPIAPDEKVPLNEIVRDRSE